MKRVFALILALLVLSACGAAEPAAAEIRPAAARYVPDDIELSGIPAVCGGAVYDCAGGSCAAVWPEAGAPLDAPEGFRATSLCSGGEGGVWTLDICWDEDHAERFELCLHRLEGGYELCAEPWVSSVEKICWSDGAL